MISLAQIKARVAAHDPTTYRTGQNTRQAAVAIVVKENGHDLDILFIKRATVDGDPWSGQMAFPGGHMEEHDQNLVMAAIRETHEETGIQLTPQQYIGAISHQRPTSRSRGREIIVAPHVFGIAEEPEVDPNHEVDDIVWGSLSKMADGTLHGTEVLEFGGNTATFNGYKLASERFVWGLTYRALQTFFSVLFDDYIVPPEAVV